MKLGLPQPFMRPAPELATRPLPPYSPDFNPIENVYPGNL
jgi:transposase